MKKTQIEKLTDQLFSMENDNSLLINELEPYVELFMHYECAMLEIEIVYGLADRQVLKNMTVAEGITVREAALQSGLEVEFPELDLQQAPLGIFGKTVKDETVLRDGDRIEVYRPLLIDPKEARRKRAGQE